MDIMMGLSAIKQTLDITKELRNIDEKVDISGLKLRLADLVERLLEAKEALQDAKDRERELLSQIASLKAALTQRGQLRDESGLLYEVDEHEKRTGEPYCNLCYVREQKLYRLRFSPAKPGSREHYHCDNCRTVITTGPALPLARRNEKPWI